MYRYKVLFEDWEAISASIAGAEVSDRLTVATIGGKKVIESFVVWADSEEEAMQIAEQVVKDLSPLIR